MNTVKLAIQKPRKFERSSKIEKITCCIIQHVTCQNTQNFPSCNLQAAGVNFYSDKKYHMTNDRWVFDQRSESIWPWNWKDQEIEFYRPKIVGSIFFYTIVPFWKTKMVNYIKFYQIYTWEKSLISGSLRLD